MVRLALAVVSVYWTAYGMFFLRAFYVDFPRVGVIIMAGMLTLILIIPLWLTINRKLDRWTGRWRMLLPVALLAHGGWLWLLVFLHFEPHLTSSTVFEDNHTTTIYYLVASVLVVLALQGIVKIKNAWGKIALALSLLAIETVGAIILLVSPQPYRRRPLVGEVRYRGALPQSSRKRWKCFYDGCYRQ